MTRPITIPARSGHGAFVERGKSVRLINTHGYQVVDTWAFSKADPGEFLSVEHTRTATRRAAPRKGDTLVTNRRRPMLTVVEDTTPGIHDTLIAACDAARYEMLGAPGHDNCAGNLATVFKQFGLALPEVPCPVNFFQNSPADPMTGEIRFLASVAKPGQFVELRAEMDLLMVFSACPQDLLPVNGPGGDDPREAHFLIV
jgi:uncharacterized protein YcgI (DUF1989 family)